MKNLFITILIVCISLIGNSQPNLVGHYPLNGNATDISSTQNHGTLNGATPYPDRFGNVDGAMYMGQNNSIDFTTLPNIWDSVSPFGFGAYTIVFWVKITGVSGNNVFITFGDGAMNGANGITFESFSNLMRIHTYGGQLFDVTQSSITTGGFSNQWIMLAYRFNGINHLNGANYSFFLNTSKADTTLQIASCPGCGAGIPYPLNNTMHFGWAPGSRYLDGAIDDVRIGHFSNFVLAKAFYNMDLCLNSISIYGDAHAGELAKEEAMPLINSFCKDFEFKAHKEYFASNMNYEGSLLYAETEGKYAGTKVFDVGEEKIVGIKSNGATTYFYQDVSLIELLASSYKNISMLYLTGAEQENHFRLLKILYPNIHHVPLGLVKVSGKKMGTRFGNVILIEDFLKEMQNELSTDNLELIYNIFAGYILKATPESDKNINMDLMTNPKNSPGLYLSYTMARIHSAGVMYGHYHNAKGVFISPFLIYLNSTPMLKFPS